MRFGFAALVLGALFGLAPALLGAGPAQAENRVFVIANNADDYGIDRCLAAGASCGAAAATAFCRAREFERAASFHKLDQDEITGATPVTTDCRAGACGAFVAIECAR